MIQAEHRMYSTAKVPFHVIKGQNEGTTVMITAGIHGTEIAGIYAARYILHRIRITKGTLVILPVINALVFRQQTSGKHDLNRTFPRSYKEHPKHRITQDVFRNVAK